MTASSFSSVSLDPPLILVCVNRQNLTHELIQQQGCFGVHILADGMQPVSDRCAGFEGEEAHTLDDIPSRIEVTGAPILEKALAWMDCSLWKACDGGDHTVFIGEIQAAGTLAGEPLLWYSRNYHRLAPGA